MHSGPGRIRLLHHPLCSESFHGLSSTAGDDPVLKRAAEEKREKTDLV